MTLLWYLGSSKKQLKREWALSCFQNPCVQHSRDIDEKTCTSHSQLTRKYPFYVWHLSKRFRSINQMEVSLEEEEAKFINLYCSDYIREAIEAAALRREKSESKNGGEAQPQTASI